MNRATDEHEGGQFLWFLFVFVINENRRRRASSVLQNPNKYNVKKTMMMIERICLNKTMRLH